MRSAGERMRFAVQRAGVWLRRPNVYRRGTAERVGIVYTARTHLSTAERLFLYALVRGTRPQRILEIGSAVGGSASIMAAALEDNGSGRIVGLDPVRLIDTSQPIYHGRLTLITQAAPDGLAPAREAAGGAFDLVFYDGPNVYTEVKRTLDALIPHLAEPARIVFDNGLHYGVHRAAAEAIARDTRLSDCGFVCSDVSVGSRHVAYSGLRLVRFESAAVSDPQPLIERACRSAGIAPPHPDPSTLNHDVWWCAKVAPCEKCAQEAARGVCEMGR